MHFFKKRFNLDKLERIEWTVEFEGQPLKIRNITSCRVFFESGDERLFNRELARELFVYLDQAEASPSTLADLQQKLDFQPSPPITLPSDADPHDWPTVAPFLRQIGALKPPNNLYMFKYDLPEGKRGAQDIIADTLEHAFQRFGWVMQEFKLHPANIRYEVEEQREPPPISDARM